VLKSFPSFARATLDTGKALLRLFALTALLASGAHFVRGQSALDGFDPNTNGYVWVVVVQPDGKILIGGNFTTVSPNGGPAVTRNRIARLNPDGSLDPGFNPNVTDTNPNTIINAIAVQADGQVLVGGFFTSIGGQMRNNIARLDATTGLADSFNPNSNERVYAIAVQADGEILAGGGFTNIGGQARNHIARLNATTGLADAFNPNANGFVYAVVVQANGKILIGGAFNGGLGNPSIGGQLRNGMARLDPTTGLADSFDPNANGAVVSIAMQADGKIVVGGTFEDDFGNPTIGGQLRNSIARLDPATGLADSFNPNASDWVLSVAVQADGKILAGGKFLTIGGQTRHSIARLDPSSGLADSFNPSPTAANEVRSVAVQADGKILMGGSFTALAPNGGPAVTRNNIARLENDGRLDRTLNLNVVGTAVYASAVQPDGKVIIVGTFTSVLGTPRNGIARLNSDGTLDTAFDPNANAAVGTIALQSDGKVLAGGDFTTIGGQARNFIARLDAATGLADAFDPNANDSVHTLTIQSDGKILAGGKFTAIGAQPRNRIARLDPVSGLADSFDPNATFWVDTIAIQSDGKILAGGDFNTMGGQTRHRIARLDPVSGSVDSFDPNASSTVLSIAIQSDGKILAGGTFRTIGGQTRHYIARLDAATGAADSFNPDAFGGIVYSIGVQSDGKILAGGTFTFIGGQFRNNIARLDAVTGSADSFNPNADGAVFSITSQSDGKILVSGPFTNIGGQSRNVFARFSNDTAARQNLSATQTTVTWTREGSSPLLNRVVFEQSSDDANFTFLGNGTGSFTPTSSVFTLSGLNLPTGQNLFIRGRGFYAAGPATSSGSIQETVRNFFFTPPTPPTPTSVVSRKTHGAAGTFDINLPLTGNAGIECRSDGGSNNHQIVFTFPSAVTFTNAAVTTGAGSVTGSSGSGTGTVTVDLTGVTNAQTIRVTLSNVSDGINMGDLSVAMSVLQGDTSGNGAVTGTDVSQTKLQSGQAVTASNFREDVVVNGTINGSDVSAVKLKSGTALPP
jgi:uncharacterized delta-60 repeat protein